MTSPAISAARVRSGSPRPTSTAWPETTGTLWEHDQLQASCKHGFASHAAVVLRRDILGLREIDY